MKRTDRSTDGLTDTLTLSCALTNKEIRQSEDSQKDAKSSGIESQGFKFMTHREERAEEMTVFSGNDVGRRPDKLVTSGCFFRF